jgi:hypothetical protein
LRWKFDQAEVRLLHDWRVSARAALPRDEAAKQADLRQSPKIGFGQSILRER